MGDGTTAARSRRSAGHALVLVLVLALCGAMAGAARAAAPLPRLQHGPAPGPGVVPGEVVVGFRASAGRTDRLDARAAAHATLVRGLRQPRTQLVQVGPGQTVDGAIRALRQRTDVRYAEPNYVVHATAVPNDPAFGFEWGLQNTGQSVNGDLAGVAGADIGAPAAWDRASGTASTVVAVVDSGVAYDHPDLAPNLWTNPGEIDGNSADDDGNGFVDDVHGWDFVDGDNTPWDLNDHGTHVAGTIAARGDNGIGIAGVAWRASIMPVRALDASGSGSDADVADAMDYAADNGARVVNLSLGGPGRSQAIADAIAQHPNTLFVVAAGNDHVDDDVTPTYPCSDPAANVVCVAATDQRDDLAWFSNYGATSVDLAAPGVDIYSTRPHYTDQLSDDFESGTIGSQWTTGGTGAGWGIALDAHGRHWLAATAFPAGADGWIRTTAPVDVGSRTDCVLRLDVATALAAGETFSVEASADGTSWQDLQDIASTDLYVDAVVVPVAAGARLYRLRVVSPASAPSDAVYVDDLSVGCPGGTYGPGDYQFLDGTSMATPHVSGAAAVLLGAFPTATVAQVKAALLDSADPVAGLAGKTVSGGRLDLRAALDALAPTPTAGAATSVGTGSATVSGRVDPRGFATTYHFELRPQGGTYGALRTPDASAGGGAGAVDVAAAVGGLAPGTTYAFRLVAASVGGTRRSGEGTFTTAPAPAPVIPTVPAPAPSPTPPTPTAPTPVPPPTRSTSARPVRCHLASRRLRCTITYRGARRATIAMRRAGRLYARASIARVRSGHPVALHLVRRPRHGRRYAVVVRLVDARGRAHVLSASVLL